MKRCFMVTQKGKSVTLCGKSSKHCGFIFDIIHKICYRNDLENTHIVDNLNLKSKSSRFCSSVTHIACFGENNDDMGILFYTRY